MSVKDKILHEAFEKNGLLTKFIPDSLVWNLITGCMQSYVEHQEIEHIQLTIGEITEIKEHKQKLKVSSCEHKWLDCGNSFFVCDKCPEWIVR